MKSMWATHKQCRLTKTACIRGKETIFNESNRNAHMKFIRAQNKCFFSTVRFIPFHIIHRIEMILNRTKKNADSTQYSQLSDRQRQLNWIYECVSALKRIHTTKNSQKKKLYFNRKKVAAANGTNGRSSEIYVPNKNSSRTR